MRTPMRTHGQSQARSLVAMKLCQNLEGAASRTRRWLALVLSFVILVMTSPVRAGHGAPPPVASVPFSTQDDAQLSTVLLGQLDVQGNVPPVQVEEYGDVLKNSLASSSYRVQTTAASEKCHALECAVNLADRQSIPLLVLARVVARERSYDLSLALHEVSTKRVLATSNETCDLCGLEEVKELISTRTFVLRDKIEALVTQSANLTISSSPTGAYVYIDGEAFGPTPRQVLVGAGEHRVEVRSDGFYPASRMVRTLRGMREIVHIEQQHLDRRRRPGQAAISPRGWAWLAMGTGVAVTAAGGVLLGIHHRPYRNDCTGDNIDATGRCRFRYNTQAAGTAMLIAGGALLVTSAVVFVMTRHRGAAAPAKAP